MRFPPEVEDLMRKAVQEAAKRPPPYECGFLIYRGKRLGKLVCGEPPLPLPEEEAEGIFHTHPTSPELSDRNFIAMLVRNCDYVCVAYGGFVYCYFPRGDRFLKLKLLGEQFKRRVAKIREMEEKIRRIVKKVVEEERKPTTEEMEEMKRLRGEASLEQYLLLVEAGVKKGEFLAVEKERL